MSDMIGDITLRISQMKTKAPFGLVPNSISKFFEGFCSKTNINLSWISVIDLNGKEFGLKTFTENLIKNNDLPTVSLLKNGLMHPDFLAKEALPKSTENWGRLKRDPKATLLKITCDLRKPKEAPETSTNFAMAQAPKPLITDQNTGKVESTGKSTPGGEVYIYASISKKSVEHILAQLKDPDGNNSYQEILGA